MTVAGHIFREYDIRGVFPLELNKNTARETGSGLGTCFRKNNVDCIAIGRDCRLSSPELSESLIDGIEGTGIKIFDIGQVPTPLLYYSLHHLDVGGGVMITGSHNPPEFNGFKVCLGKSTIYGDQIQEIRNIIEKKDFVSGKGSHETVDLKESYVEYITGNIKPGEHKKRVVIDGGNGTGGELARKIYEKLGFDVIPLFCEPDGNFPNHHPDPIVPENLASLIEKVRETSADLGIAFDGDADRLGAVDHEGNIIWGDMLMVIFSRDLLTRHPGATVIGEVKCSQVFYDDIARHGGKGIMWKTGHSLIKNKMKEEKALLAGEISGHIFFSERYFGYDDGIYAGARLLEILSKTHKSLKDMLADVPGTITTPEIRIDCPDDIKFKVVEELVSEFKKDYRVIDVDGARVLFDNGWGLVRASNTQPVLVLRFEADNETNLEKIRKIVMQKVENKI